jgi:hypothetical protein
MSYLLPLLSSSRSLTLCRLPYRRFLMRPQLLTRLSALPHARKIP